MLAIYLLLKKKENFKIYMMKNEINEKAFHVEINDHVFF